MPDLEYCLSRSLSSPNRSHLSILVQIHTPDFNLGASPNTCRQRTEHPMNRRLISFAADRGRLSEYGCFRVSPWLLGILGKYLCYPAFRAHPSQSKLGQLPEKWTHMKYVPTTYQHPEPALKQIDKVSIAHLRKCGKVHGKRCSAFREHQSNPIDKGGS